MNTFLSTTFMPDNSSLYEALRNCISIGINSIEIGSNHSYQSEYDYLLELNLNFLVHNYFPVPKKSFVLNIASQDKQIREQSIKHIELAIDMCSKLDAKLYTFHPGFLTDPNGSNLSNNNYDFQWIDKNLINTNYEKARNNMYSAFDHIITIANKRKIKLAIETEGSFHKKEHILMQKPEEFQDFISRYNYNDLGINLNIGHLNLAANAFNFKKVDFVNLVEDYIVAMELSHNDGKEDQHLPLKEKGWYWDFVNDIRFKNAYKILELRNIPISKIKQNLDLIKKKTNEISSFK